MSAFTKKRSADEVMASASVKRGKKKGGKSSKARDTRPAHTRYRAEKHLEHNKVRRILKSNGERDARDYAAAKSITKYLEELMKRAGSSRVG